MSYNISSVTVLGSSANMAAKDIKVLIKKYRDLLPESCFLLYLEEKADDYLLQGDPCGLVYFNDLTWCHNFSGNSYDDVLIKHIVPKIKGKIDVVFKWEGGDSVSGLQIKDGIAVECNVEYHLVPKKQSKAK